MKGLLTNLAVLSLLATAALAAEEAPDRARTFQIAAQSLDSALVEFSQQSGLQLVVTSDTIRGKSTRGVQGSYKPTVALVMLLEGLGLEYSVVNPRSLAIRTAKPEGSGPATKTSFAEESVPERPLRLARVEETASKPVEEKVPEGSSQGGIPEILVKGSKVLNMDIERTRDDVQPYVVFHRDQIEQSSALNIGEFLRIRLPMYNAGTFSQSHLTSSNTSSSINLRGLGTNQTLILVNGRRIPARNATAAGNGAGQGDLNGIPLSMIERVEILPSTASGIYGGGATGGVINVITKKDYSGVEATLSYGNTFDTDASTRRMDLNSSFNLEGGKTFLTFNTGYSNGTELLTRDRDFSRRARALLLANNPAAMQGPTAFPPTGYTSNIRSSNGANLVLKPQYAVNGVTALNSHFTHVPVGYAGLSVDGAAPLLAQAGSYNLDLPDTVSQGGLSGIFAVPEVKTWAIGGRRAFGANVEGYLDVTSQQNIGRYRLGFVSPTSVTLPVAAPNNPFTTPIVVAYPVTNVSYVSRSDNSSSRIAGGVIVRLPRDWTASAEFSRGKSRNQGVQSSSHVGDPDGTGPLPSYATALAAGTLDVMRDLNVYPLDYTAYRMPKAESVTVYRSETREGTLNAAGPAWELPAGPISLAFSASTRQEDQPSVINESLSTVPSNLTWHPAVGTKQKWMSLETRVPLFPEKNTSLLRAMEFHASVRYETYRSKGPVGSYNFTVTAPGDPTPASFNYLIRNLDATSAMAGLRWAPVQDVALRASWGTGFLPPSIGQLGASFVSTSTGVNVVDPKRGGILANTGPVTIDYGGTEGLKPEYSESVSGGVILTPRFLPGFRLSVDYTRIEKTDEIAPLSAQQGLDYEDQIPGRIVRDPLTPADQQLGYTGGRITRIFLSATNVARRELIAYDIQADYEVSTGDRGHWRFYAIATYQPTFARQILPNAPHINDIGFTGPLDWRGNMGVDWRRGSWSAGWNMQYDDAYLGYSVTASAATIATFSLNNGRVEIPSQSYHDVYASYEFGRSGEGWRRHLNDTRVTLGVQNALNTSPPITAASFATSGFSDRGDPRLARYTITLRRQF